MKKNPIFTTALIAGDCVILDAIAKAGLLDKIKVVFVDTYFLFPESVDFLREVRRGVGWGAVWWCGVGGGGCACSAWHESLLLQRARVSLCQYDMSVFQSAREKHGMSVGGVIM